MCLHCQKDCLGDYCSCTSAQAHYIPSPGFIWWQRTVDQPLPRNGSWGKLYDNVCQIVHVIDAPFSFPWSPLDCSLHLPPKGLMSLSDFSEMAEWSDSFWEGLCCIPGCGDHHSRVRLWQLYMLLIFPSINTIHPFPWKKPWLEPTGYHLLPGIFLGGIREILILYPHLGGERVVWRRQGSFWHLLFFLYHL